MVLCFGTFASVLNLCKLNLTQERFVPRIAWVIDRRNHSLGSELDFDVEDPGDITPNKDEVSRLLSCQRPLVLKDGQPPSQKLAHERFTSQVMPFIKENMIAKALLAVLHIIYSDSTIENEHKGTFKKDVGMDKDELLHQTRFSVPDFFSRVLLYTTHTENRDGQPYAGKITQDFIKEVAANSWVELKWDAATQTVELIPYEEKRFLDEINTLTELRLSLMQESVSNIDTDWLGVDKSILFPNSFSHI